MVVVRNEKEFAKAVKNNEDTIEIEGDLANKTIKIKATGKVVWGVVIAAVAIIVVAILAAPATGGTSGVAALVGGSGATALIGAPTMFTLVGIAVAAGGIGVLTAIRDKYRIIEKSSNRVVLKRK